MATPPFLTRYGLSSDPFHPNEIKKNSLHLFVGRESEHTELRNCVHLGRVAIYGESGVGKTSFLNKFRENYINESDTHTHPVIYIPAASQNYRLLYYRLVYELIQSYDKSELVLSEELDKILEELGHKPEAVRKVLKKCLTESRNTEGVGEPTEIAEYQVKEIFENIVTTSQTDVFFLIDELERLATMNRVNDGKFHAYFESIIKYFDERFSENSNLFFVLTLDMEFIEMTGDGDRGPAFSLGNRIKIPRFRFSELSRAILKRLESAGWTQGLNAFIDHSTLVYLAVLTAGHPRQSIDILGSVMKRKGKEDSLNVSRSDIDIILPGRDVNLVDEDTIKIYETLRGFGKAMNQTELASKTNIDRKKIRNSVPILEELKLIQVRSESGKPSQYLVVQDA